MWRETSFTYFSWWRQKIKCIIKKGRAGIVVLSQHLITYKIWTAEEKRVSGINDLNHNITEDLIKEISILRNHITEWLEYIRNAQMLNFSTNTSSRFFRVTNNASDSLGVLPFIPSFRKNENFIIMNCILNHYNYCKQKVYFLYFINLFQSYWYWL